MDHNPIREPKFLTKSIKPLKSQYRAPGRQRTERGHAGAGVRHLRKAIPAKVISSHRSLQTFVSTRFSKRYGGRAEIFPAQGSISQKRRTIPKGQGYGLVQASRIGEHDFNRREGSQGFGNPRRTSIGDLQLTATSDHRKFDDEWDRDKLCCWARNCNN
jgi:hypothetical protein